jgi:GTP cyclohydrolase I
MKPETNGHRHILSRAELGESGVDLPAAEQAAADLLRALGADVESDHLRETPRRVAKAYAELLDPTPFRATTFPNDEGYDELILVRDIPFQSLCAHHLLPFHGMAHVASSRRTSTRAEWE